MRIEYAIPAKYAEVNDNLATIIGAGIDTYGLPELPAVINVMLAIRVVGQADEFPGDHRLQCRVRNAAGGLAGPELDAQVHLEASPTNVDRADWLNNVMLAVGVQFEAAAAESYTIAIMFDDAEFAVPIHVVINATQ